MSVLSAQFPTMMTMPEIFTFCWDCIKNLLLIENLLPCANLGLLLQHLPNPFSVSYVDLIISECTITCIFHQSSAESDPSNLTSSNLYATRYLLLNLKFKFQKLFPLENPTMYQFIMLLAFSGFTDFLKKRRVNTISIFYGNNSNVYIFDYIFFYLLIDFRSYQQGYERTGWPISKSRSLHTYIRIYLRAL